MYFWIFAQGKNVRKVYGRFSGLFLCKLEGGGIQYA